VMESMVEWGMGVALVARYGPGLKPCAEDILSRMGPECLRTCAREI